MTNVTANVTQNLMGNLSYQIGTQVLGSGNVTWQGQTFAVMFLGVLLVSVILLYLFHAKLGLFGAIVIIPPTLIVLGEQYLPSWIMGLMWIALGFIIGLMMLALWNENK
jgi:hypothetical protein